MLEEAEKHLGNRYSVELNMFDWAVILGALGRFADTQADADLIKTALRVFDKIDAQMPEYLQGAAKEGTR